MSKTVTLKLLYLKSNYTKGFMIENNHTSPVYDHGTLIFSYLLHIVLLDVSLEVVFPVCLDDLLEPVDAPPVLLEFLTNVSSQQMSPHVNLAESCEQMIQPLPLLQYLNHISLHVRTIISCSVVSRRTSLS